MLYPSIVNYLPIHLISCLSISPNVRIESILLNNVVAPICTLCIRNNFATILNNVSHHVFNQVIFICILFKSIFIDCKCEILKQSSFDVVCSSPIPLNIIIT